jgi:predicted hydrocarbon binding protein
MHGLIFMTWEKYLAERFGTDFLKRYRDSIGETTATLPLANRLYDDAVLLAGVGAASQLSHFPAETLLHEYGRYFIINWLTSHLCMYILTSVESARDLLLTMRDAHARLRRTNDSLQPPLFEYRSVTDNEVVLVYDSPRQLCPVLLGAIQGAAERYGETVQIQELSCMKQGAAVCQFKAHFTPPESDPMRYSRPKRAVEPGERMMLLRQIWTTLPEAGTINGLTLRELQERLRWYKRVNEHQLRPAVLLEAVQQLQFAGYVMSTAGTVGDSLIDRRYWHVHRHM